ncbi:hypothetical protein [Frankia canadensis]|uniref:hypothetical protein n=1 Tax=Frankia canadensis TaxID=1836972 RepID=UPI0010551C83|nr:hypothetical protein [Frankia canadensis]
MAGDARAGAACLADVLWVDMPAVGRYRFQGEESMRTLLAAALDHVDDIRFESVTCADGRWILTCPTTIMGQSFAAEQRLTLDGDGRISTITLMGQPPFAFVLEMERIGPRLVAPEPRTRPGRGRVYRRARRPPNSE